MRSRAGFLAALAVAGCAPTFETYGTNTKVQISMVKPLPPAGSATPHACGNGQCDLAAGETVANCPMDCSAAKVESYNKQTLCEQVEALFTPKLVRDNSPSIDEQIDQVLVAAATVGKKVRIIGRTHTSNEQLCGDGFTISSDQMDTLHERNAPLDRDGHPDPNLLAVPARIECWQPDAGKPELVPTVVVGAGVRLFELNDWLQQTTGPDCANPGQTKRYSLAFAVPQVRLPSVAGAISTGTHGSAPGRTTMISAYVDEVWGRHVIQDPQSTTPRPVAVELHVSAALTGDSAADAVSTEEMRALRAGVGMLGMLTRVRFRLSDAFSIEAWGVKLSDAGLFREPEGPFHLLKNCEFGFLNWFPWHHKLIKTCGKKAPPGKPDNLGAASNLLSPPIPTAFASAFPPSLHYGVFHPCWNCILEWARMNAFFPAPMLDSDGQARDDQKIVGPSYMMMSSVLSPEQKDVSEEDWEIAVPAQNAVAVLKYAQDYFLKHHMCFPLIGIFLRFGRVEDATMMAHVSTGGAFKSGDPMMYFEMVFYEPTDKSPAEQAALRTPYMEVAQTLINKYGARPHWGKSRLDVVQVEASANNGAGNYAPESRTRFQQIAKKYDPFGIFRNDFGVKARLLPQQ